MSRQKFAQAALTSGEIQSTMVNGYIHAVSDKPKRESYRLFRRGLVEKRMLKINKVLYRSEKNILRPNLAVTSPISVVCRDRSNRQAHGVVPLLCFVGHLFFLMSSRASLPLDTFNIGPMALIVKGLAKNNSAVVAT